MAQVFDFETVFRHLTGNSPFPWQESLFHDWFKVGKIPEIASLPTGLGKTNIISIWLIASGLGAPLPRRLVYVVNRRTVIDQTTNETEHVRKRISQPERYATNPEQLRILTLLADCLRSLCSISKGTVDMIGSRLLFSGYRIGFKSRPLHAGFLAQDALLVHDEAHLEPAFQKLIEAIRDEQHHRERTGKLALAQASRHRTDGDVANSQWETEDGERQDVRIDEEGNVSTKRDSRSSDGAHSRGLATVECQEVASAV